MNRDAKAAGRAVSAALAERSWTASDLMRETGLDSGTVSDFLAGKRWPQAPTRGKIERALGWPYGTIEAIADGDQPAVSLVPPPLKDEAQPLDVVDAILADPYLLPEAKEHFLNQYLLLLRVARGDGADVSRDTDRTEPTADRRGVYLEALPAVAHGGDPAHAGQIAAMARRIRARIDREERDDNGG